MNSQFNFNQELSILVDYNVVSLLVPLIVHEKHSKDSDVLQMVAGFFRRLVFQLKQPWIFYQLESLSAFHAFLQRNASNNTLMRGINEQKTYVQKRLAFSET